MDSVMKFLLSFLILALVWVAIMTTLLQTQLSLALLFSVVTMAGAVAWILKSER